MEIGARTQLSVGYVTLDRCILSNILLRYLNSINLFLFEGKVPFIFDLMITKSLFSASYKDIKYARCNFFYNCQRTLNTLRN